MIQTISPPALDTLALRHDVPAWTIPLLDKASTPYSHLIALKGEDTASSGISLARLPGEHRGTRGPGPPQGHRLSDASPYRSDATPYRSDTAGDHA